MGAFNRSFIPVKDFNTYLRSPGISPEFVQHGHHALFSCFFPAGGNSVKPSGMNHHGPGRRICKPSVIQGRRFACAEKIPYALMPDFHPGMIVVTVGPFRRVYLSGRNSDTPHRVHCKHGFFSAPSVSSAVYGQGGQRPVVAAVIGSFLGAPVVYFFRRGFSVFLFQQIRTSVFFHEVMDF